MEMEILSFEERIKWRNMVIFPSPECSSVLEPFSKAAGRATNFVQDYFIDNNILLVAKKYWHFHTVAQQNIYTCAKWHCKLHHGVGTPITEHHSKHSSNSHMQVYYTFFHIIHDQSTKESHKILAGIPAEIHHPDHTPAQFARLSWHAAGVSQQVTVPGSGKAPLERPTTGFGRSQDA